MCVCMLSAGEWQERFAVASAARAKGNELYGEKKFADAAAEYDKSWVHLDRIVKPTPEQRREVNAMKVVVALNLAQAKLKLGMYRDVIEHCNQVLTRQAANVKGLFRRSKAYAALCWT